MLRTDTAYTSTLRSLNTNIFFLLLMFFLFYVLNAPSVVNIQEEEFTRNNMWQDE